MSKSQEATLKYPENLKLKKAIKQGDVAGIADKAGRTKSWVYMVLNGHRPQSIKFQKAFVEYMHEKKALRNQVNEIIENK